ncbi:MAG TPA: hypothetical protein VFJ74_08990 [Gemmatimonadaceae bacterium]|nr:hypothetical protein [Gemmatimonadaceae bacterium]
MRRTILAVRRPLALAALVALAAPLAGCNSLFKHGTLIEEPPAHREPTTTSIYGDWVLATPSDSTAFAGASLVELNVTRSSFTITATYPQSSPTVVQGTLSTTDGALLTLTPTSGTRSGRGGPLALVAGQPVTVLASAAGNTMVFSPPGGVTASDPSSVWHRKAAAKAAGDLPAKTP